jgi:hypothetical protein
MAQSHQVKEMLTLENWMKFFIFSMPNDFTYEETVSNTGAKDYIALT